MTTLVAKVTYDLAPLRCEVSRQPEPIYTVDVPEPQAGRPRAVREASDLAPLKPGSDVVVVGKAFAPQGRPVAELDVRLVVGELDKTLRVTGPRRFGPDGAPRAPVPVAEVALDWSLAAGGADSWNPVGVRSDLLDLGGTSDAPSLLPLGFDVRSRDDYVPPVGFGPIAPEWAPRRERLHHAESAWLTRPAPDAAWSDTADATFFLAAPPDQQLRRPLRADESIVLENLHRSHARLVTRLPAVPLHVLAVDPVRGREAIGLVPDTLWIDTERSLVTVTSRLAVPTRAVEGRDVFVWLEGFDANVAEDIASAADETAQGRGIPAAIAASGALPFRATSVGTPQRTREEDEFEKLATGTIAAPDAESLGLSMPFMSAAGPPSRARAITAPVTPPPVAAAPPSPVRPLSSPPLAPPMQPPLQPPMQPMQPMAPPSPSGPIAPPASIPLPGWVPTAPPSVPASKIDTWKLHEQASARRTTDEPAVEVARVEAASPAAAAAHAPAVRAAAVEVAWFESPTDVETASRSKLLREQLGEQEDEFLSPVEATGGTLERARRDVARWLSSAKPLEIDRLPQLYATALTEDPGERTFVVLSGELAWTFDPRESIRAWVAIGTPLSADPRIKEAIEAAERSLQENLASLPDVLQGACDRLRDAVRSVTKMAGATPIEAAAERYLVEERGFGKRRLWGDLKIRGHLHAPRARAPLPVYFQHGAGFEAPLAQRFAARVLGEVRTRQDPTEPSGICLRAIAFGLEVA